MKSVIAFAAALLISTSAFAEGNNRNYNNNVAAAQSFSQSRSSSRSNSNSASQAINSGVNNNTNIRDRLQAPGFGVGGGYCSNGLSVSFPGGGFGFSAMERMCKIEIGARVVRTYINAPNAASYVCSQYEFKNLPACRAAYARAAK